MGALGRSPVGRFGGRASDAARGVALVYRQSGNARIELVLAYLALSAALAEGGGWRAGVVCVASAAVLALEAMNSAVEFAVDRIGRERHPLAAAAKDSAAGAVLIAAVGAAAMAAWVLLPGVGDCWRAFRGASVPAAVGWLALLALLAAGVVRPERQPAQGPDAGRRMR